MTGCKICGWKLNTGAISSSTARKKIIRWETSGRQSFLLRTQINPKRNVWGLKLKKTRLIDRPVSPASLNLCSPKLVCAKELPTIKTSSVSKLIRPKKNPSNIIKDSLRSGPHGMGRRRPSEATSAPAAAGTPGQTSNFSSQLGNKVDPTYSIEAAGDDSPWASH